MRYPTLPASRTIEIAQARLRGHGVRHEPFVEWRGTGDDVDLGPVDEVVDALEMLHAAFVDGPQRTELDTFEGIAAGPIHHALRDLPIEILDDPGFWRFLTIDKFWWLVSWREPKALEAENLDVYIDGTRPTECVILRCFLRGQAVVHDDDYDLTVSIPRGADFWRSHVLRVQTASAPRMARAFARAQATDRMPTTELRTFARRLNRTWTNVVLHLYDEAESTTLLNELRHTLTPEPETTES